MKIWTLVEAKNNLSKIYDLVVEGGAQIISPDGDENGAVVLLRLETLQSFRGHDAPRVLEPGDGHAQIFLRRQIVERDAGMRRRVRALDAHVTAARGP